MRFKRRKVNFSCCRNSVQPEINSSPRRNWHRFTNQLQKPAQPEETETSVETETDSSADEKKEKSDQ